ncbi:MAG: flagellar cap protein FliD N-terminal domain-containing protein, partial [Oscillospiraceae bacterium]
MGISVNDYYNSTRKGVSGLVSGLDTDEIIKGMTMGTTSKIDSQLQQKQIAIWKQEAYRDITKRLNEFQSKYLSYSAGKNNLLSSGFFDTEKVKTESKYVKISGNTNTIKNLVINDIKQLATTSNITTSKNLSNHEILGTSAVKDSWNKADLEKASVMVKVDDTVYTIDLSKVTFKKDATDAEKATAIADAINKSIESTSALKGKFRAGISTDGKFEFAAINADSTVDTSAKFSFFSETENIQNALGIPTPVSVDADIKNGIFTATQKVDVTKMQKNVTLADELAGKSLEINLNGVKKTITFNETDKEKYNTADKMQAYLKEKIDRAVGAGKVDVSLSG